MKRLLFFTNSDYGQANVVLATAHSLVHNAPGIEIHIASFHGLQSAVRSTSDYAIATAPKVSDAKPLAFHGLSGISWGPASFRPETAIAAANELTPGLFNSAKCVAAIPATLQPWRPDEFLAIYRESEQVLDQVNPDLIIVEPLFTPGMTLCHHLNANWTVLAPNTIKDFAVPLQPSLAMLWKYPLVCSAMPFPLPWSLIPRNILLNLVVAYAVLSDTSIKNTTELLRQKVSPTITVLTANELGVLKAPPPDLRILVANSADIDYPFDILPPHIIPCGPIVRAVPPIHSVDHELANWLNSGPTVYVNLGTHLKASPEEATEMASAFRDILDQAGRFTDDKRHQSLQILWKLGRKAGRDGSKPEKDVYEGPWRAVVDVLRPELESGRVRITDWVGAEPKSIVESGQVICSVNHGGANSFYEALCAGVPQVLLPPWSDCFDFANRVELLGIGRWANKKAKPRWECKELASALVEVLLGPEADEIIQSAKNLASSHPEWAGRERAAEEIAALTRLS
ncbi:hypothetical protein BX600DRAFT_513309 [Xylariales sp. PMI_506]|nr:hypothetical protein BX600DRAFT_513309 [Xylariales sp. PMI_506]